MEQLKYSIIAVLILSLVSCQSAFDFGDDGLIPYDDIFTNYDLSSSYMNTCYQGMSSIEWNYGTGTFMAVYTDEAQDANDVDADNLALKYYNGEMSVNNTMFTSGHYSILLKAIYNCNVFIKNIGQLEFYTLEDNRKWWPAEARILRAHYYLQLIKRYGPMPYLDEHNFEDYDFSSIERPTFYSNVESIIKDCRDAIAIGGDKLPWRVSIPSDNGRATKAMAYAVMSQAILYAASPLWNDGVNHWAEAAVITKEAMDALEAANFKLMDQSANPGDWHSVYQEYFMTQAELDGSAIYDKETIYSQLYELNLWGTYGVPIATGATRAGISPSQELVDAYDTADGIPVLDLSQPYTDSDHLQPNYNSANSMYDQGNPYINRDPRLLSSIICNGDFFNIKEKTSPVETFVGGNSGISTNNIRYTRTGYYIRKYIHYLSSSSANNDGYWKPYRMAEIYLNYAEAEFYANGVTEAAVSALNKTRERAFDPQYHATALIQSSIPPTQFVQRLRNERRVEFAFEELRYFDLRRWKVQDKYEGIVTGMSITQRGGALTYERKVIQRRNVTDAKYLMWPIPKDEQDRFNYMDVNFQNPGW